MSMACSSTGLIFDCGRTLRLNREIRQLNLMGDSKAATSGDSAIWQYQHKPLTVDEMDVNPTVSISSIWW
jgi:hypothetical protein